MYIGGTPLKVNTAPKLAIVDFTRETHLFKTTDSSRRNLKVALESVVEALHPQGTMAFALPRPWLTSSVLVGGRLDQQAWFFAMNACLSGFVCVLSLGWWERV